MVSKAQTLTSPTAGATAAPVANVVRCVIEGELEHSKDKGKSWSPTFVMVRAAQTNVPMPRPFTRRRRAVVKRSVSCRWPQLSLAAAAER